MGGWAIIYPRRALRGTKGVGWLAVKRKVGSRFRRNDGVVDAGMTGWWRWRGGHLVGFTTARKCNPFAGYAFDEGWGRIGEM